MTINEFDTETDNYDIEFHFDKSSVPDTTLPIYNQLVRMPDLKSWDLWFSSGSIAIYPYITEFIARSKAKAAMDDTTPLF